MQDISSAIELPGDLPGIMRTLLLVQSIKGAAICCAQGQIIYADKRGANARYRSRQPKTRDRPPASHYSSINSAFPNRNGKTIK